MPQRGGDKRQEVGCDTGSQKVLTAVYPYSMFNVVGPPDLRWFVATCGELTVFSDCPLKAFAHACEQWLEGARGMEWVL